MNPRIADVWVYLSASPLLGLTLTPVAYQAAYWIYQRAGFNPLLNPVLLAIIMLVTALHVTGTSYATYFDGAQFVHFLLGPATVALAVPLYLATTRSRGSQRPSTGCWGGSRLPRRVSDGSSPTRRTSSAPRWRRSASTSRWPANTPSGPTSNV